MIHAGEAEPCRDGQRAGDDILAERARRDATAFAELYRRYVTRVYHYHLARVGTKQDAQDLTTVTFLAALEGIGRYEPSGRFAAWLLTIARHKATDYFRTQRPPLSLDVAAGLTHPAPLLEEVVGQRLQLEQVQQALGELAPERAEAVALRFFAELSTAETAEVMGKSEAAVKMLVYRAVKELRERLAHVKVVHDEKSG